MSCGLNHTLALSTDGLTVWAFGDGDYGKLGNGSNGAEMTPAVVERLNGVGIIKIAAGTQFSVALSKSGVVYTWGQGILSFLPIQNFASFHDVYRPFPDGKRSSIDYRLPYLYSTSHVSKWYLFFLTDRLTGHNESVRFTNKPQAVAALSGHFIEDISVGAEHTLAVSGNGDVFGWGNNVDGQLGLGHTNIIRTPHLISSLSGKNIKRVRSICYSDPFFSILHTDSFI